MARNLALLLVLLLIGACSKGHSILGSWQNSDDGPGAIWTFNSDNSWMIEMPEMGSTWVGIYRLDGESLALKSDKVFEGSQSRPEVSPARELIIRWIDDNEFSATSSDSSFSGNPLRFVRMNAEAVAKARSSRPSAQIPIPPDLPNANESPQGQPSPGQNDGQACATNLKQVAIGLLMYSQDYDERLPQASNWNDVLFPYVKDRAIFTCPAVRKLGKENGYSYNLNIAGAQVKEIQNPAQRILFFDSTNLSANAADTGSSVPRPGRHDGANNFAFLDGHVAPIR